MQVAVEEKQSEVDALAAVAKEKRAEADRLAAIEPSEITNEDMKRGKKIKSSGLMSSSLKAGQEAKNKMNIPPVAAGAAALHGDEQPRPARRPKKSSWRR